MPLYTETLNEINEDGTESYARKGLACTHAISSFATKQCFNHSLSGIQFDFKKEWLPPVEKWPKSKGFKVQARLVPDDTDMARLYIDSKEQGFDRLFHNLCDDLLSILERFPEPKAALSEMYKHLKDQQEFYKLESSEALNVDRQVGLFGELYLLKELFLPRCGAELSIPAWRGCKGASQDYQFNNFALEVKTTRAVEPNEISISSIRQLDEPGIENMFLSVVWVHKNESNGETLPEIVEAIRSSITNQLLGEFNKGLEKTGYLDKHKEKYTARYILKDVFHFKVEDRPDGKKFPRILHNDIATGVSKVSYSISFALCSTDFKIEVADLETAMLEIRE